MPRVNRTRYAILGMLMSGPRSGYDLKKDFEEQIGHFWSESLGQIYPTLGRLKDEKLVSVSVKREGVRPERKVYRITKKGETVFREWLTRPAEPIRWRNELLLKVFFGTAMEPTDVLQHIQQLQASELETRSLYQHFANEIEARKATTERKLYWRLALSSGRHINQARLNWCRESIEEIKKFTAKTKRRKKTSYE
jgi:DNA-binding PadR family transcriptional regulator